MGRSILPKLAWALDNRLTVNPACQDLAAWNSVVAWAPVMSPHMFAGLLESRFFPKWHGVLHYWLSNMPDFDEVTAWFRGWKVRSPPPFSLAVCAAETRKPGWRYLPGVGTTSRADGCADGCG